VRGPGDGDVLTLRNLSSYDVDHEFLLLQNYLFRILRSQTSFGFTQPVQISILKEESASVCLLFVALHQIRLLQELNAIYLLKASVSIHNPSLHYVIIVQWRSESSAAKQWFEQLAQKKKWRSKPSKHQGAISSRNKKCFDPKCNLTRNYIVTKGLPTGGWGGK